MFWIYKVSLQFKKKKCEKSKFDFFFHLNIYFIFKIVYSIFKKINDFEIFFFLSDIQQIFKVK